MSQFRLEAKAVIGLRVTNGPWLPRKSQISNVYSFASLKRSTEEKRDRHQAATALRRMTRELPIVFVNVVGPVEGGFVTSLARPTENVTGFTNVEIVTSGKWFELLKEVAPHIFRVLLLFRSNTPETTLRLPTVEKVTASFGMTIKLANVTDHAGIARAIEGIRENSDTGMVVMPSPVTAVHRGTIITMAADRHIPAITPTVIL
jgi:putative tryptophan/tyrosine transport system substrate-binding protein